VLANICGQSAQPEAVPAKSSIGSKAPERESSEFEEVRTGVQAAIQLAEMVACSQFTGRRKQRGLLAQESVTSTPPQWRRLRRRGDSSSRDGHHEQGAEKLESGDVMVRESVLAA